MTTSFRLPALTNSILLQAGAVLLVCQILAHGLTIAFMLWRFERPDLLTATSVSTVQAIGLYEALNQATDAERGAIEAAILRAHPTIKIIDASAASEAGREVLSGNDMFEGLLRARPNLRSTAKILSGATGRVDDDLIAVPLNNGRLFVFVPEIGERTMTFPRIVGMLFVAMLVVPLAFLSLWGLKMLTAPLRQLSVNADRFAIDLDPTPMAEQGPTEIRTLARAFNTMKGRIRQLLDSRSRMLAAVSHDLRTPLTRLRLRAESLPDSDDKERMLKDVVTMDKMIGHALSYLRDQASQTVRERVDVATLLESICDDFADTGRNATFEGPRNVVLECEPDLLTRAISNLVDNALKFGGIAKVSLQTCSPSDIVIRIEDEGPGIPDHAKFMAFEPFSRGDQARGAPEADGFGLGLAIAKQIIERHGGQITLHDREPHGLNVRIVLPVRGGLEAAVRPALPLSISEKMPSGVLS
jgi:signal transduction histidine kinase